MKYASQILSRLRRAWHSMSGLEWRVLSVLLVVALASSLTATSLCGETWGELLLNLGTEMAGAVVTYVLLQMVIGTRTRKADLIAQMGSNVRDVAVPAADELKRHGWLTDGSLRGADLVAANLQGVGLLRANLQKADLAGANLQEAGLWEANLQGANLWDANLQGARLWGANLQDATLWEANLQGASLLEANLQEADLRAADLSTAHNLETAHLDGAKVNSKTKRPEGFQWPDTVVVVED